MAVGWPFVRSNLNEELEVNLHGRVFPAWGICAKAVLVKRLENHCLLSLLLVYLRETTLNTVF